VAAGPEPPLPGDGERAPAAPSAWRIAASILLLPFTMTVIVPAAILALGDGSAWDIGTPARIATVIAGLLALGAGLALFATTVRLFTSLGRGTLAPWDPPERLVVRGPYRHLRHPMISGVALVLAGEVLLVRSTGIAIWLAGFVTVNAFYLPLVEEPALVRRFGDDYERYMDRVPRWLPRLRGPDD
jgi:protein-S-isoprenylcysteine O-methyltransferase Ste14